jgi:hypothetical protein
VIENERIEHYIRLKAMYDDMPEPTAGEYVAYANRLRARMFRRDSVWMPVTGEYNLCQVWPTRDDAEAVVKAIDATDTREDAE